MSNNRNDVIFGKLAVKAGYITKKQMNEVFKVQQALAERGQTANVGQIMAAKGLLTRAQVITIRRHQKKIDANRVFMMCISCGAKYKIRNYRPGKKIPCQKCGERLQKTDQEETTADSVDADQVSQTVQSTQSKTTDTIDRVRDMLADMDSEGQGATKEQTPTSTAEKTLDVDTMAETASETMDDVSRDESGDTADLPEPSKIVEGARKQAAIAKTGDTADLPPTDDSLEDTQDLLALMDGEEDGSLNVTIKIDRADMRQTPEKAKMNIRPLKVTLDDKGDSVVHDFSILHPIGKGGMAEVYAARQASVDRLIALKMIKTDITVDDETRYKFVSEAIVTGDLDHPNIVPIHDLGVSQNGTLFYSMKHVEGVPWESMLGKKTLDENLEILLRVCDAIAFAHDKGIVHRDLKPLNIMLGDFGEVLVMDWGLAISFDEKGKAERLSGKMGMAGTPAFMAPEMARCDSRRIDTRSDIYLLGGILYKIVTGLRPHESKSVVDCVQAAMQNIIQPTEVKGELVDIALKAMATAPEDRFQTVKAFQEAIREYQSHAESITLANSAIKDIENAETHSDYDSFSHGLYRCREALEMWPENETASQWLDRGTLSYAQCAFEKDDFDLAASLLNAENEQHRELLTRVENARKRREDRKKRLKLLSFGVRALAVLIIVILGIAFFWIKGEKERAVTAEKEARIAQKQESVQRQKAEQENYFNILTIAQRKIDDSLLDQAQTLLLKPSEKLREWEWRRLMHLCNLERATLKGHTDSVMAVAFAPDGKRVVTGSDDTLVRIWNKESGQLLKTLTGHQAAVKYVAFSDDGELVVSVDSNDAIKNWNSKTGEEVEVKIEPTDTERSVAFSPDGSLQVLTRLDNQNSAIVSETATGVELMTLKGHTGKVVVVEFAPDGKRVATGSADKSAKIWDIQTGLVLATLEGHTQGVNAVSFSADGEELITGSNDKTARIWGTKSGRDVTLQDEELKHARSIAFSSDSQRIVTANRSIRRPTAILWDASNGKIIRKMEGHTHYIYAIAYSPDGKTILTGSRDKTAILWNAADGHKIHTLEGHAGSIYAVAFSPDGSRLYTASWDKTVRIWDAKSGELLNTLKGHTAGVTAIDVSPDGSHIVTGASINGRKTENEAASKKQTVMIWDAQSGQKLKALVGHDNSVYDVAYSPDGKLIASASWDGSVKIWDAIKGAELKTLEGHSQSIQAAVFSPNGQRLATGSWDNTVKIWDIDTGRELLTLKDHTARVTDVAFSPDGRQLAASARDETVVIWNTYHQSEKEKR